MVVMVLIIVPIPPFPTNQSLGEVVPGSLLLHLKGMRTLLFPAFPASSF